jgi:hypothetical protein
MNTQHRMDTERWFRRRGLPMFIEDYSVKEDILTRVFPFMGLVMFAELFLSFGDQWSGGAQLGAFSAGAAMVVGAFVGVNVLRRRRPFQLPDDVGVPEIALYLVLPVIPSIIGNTDNPLTAVLGTLGLNAALLIVAFVVTKWGLVPMVRWAASQMILQVGQLSTLALKSLPLVLLFSAFIFLNAEMWQVANDMTMVAFVGIVALVTGIGGAFVLLSVRRIGLDLGSFESWHDVHDLLAGTPMATATGSAPTGPPVVALSRRGRWNLTLRLFVAQSTQILLVSTVTTLFYVLFGMLTVRETTMLQWTTVGELTRGRDWLVSLDVLGNTYVFTRQLVVVATFIGLVSGLQFTVQVLTDPTYRRDFAQDMIVGARRALAVRAAYLAALRR